jgi:hypothetical protein
MAGVGCGLVAGIEGLRAESGRDLEVYQRLYP